MDKSIEEELRIAISSVNSSLKSYESDFSSYRRYCDDDYESKERCKTFEQFIELRFNFELSLLPSFRKLQTSTQGHLFKCISVDGFDAVKNNRYKMATLELLNPSMVETEIENLATDVEDIRKLLGGTIVKFNNVQKKIRLVIE